MGIKMNIGFHRGLNKSIFVQYANSSMNNDLLCTYCSVPISYVQSHECKDNGVPAFFRLKPKQLHSKTCQFNTVGQLDMIAKESAPALFEQIGKDTFILRINILTEVLTQLEGQWQFSSDSEPAQTKKFTSIGKLPPYLNTIRRILKLRMLIEDERELANLIKLRSGSITIRWKDFYYEADDFERCYNYLINLSKNGGLQHPICLQGRITKKVNPIPQYQHFLIKLQSVRAGVSNGFEKIVIPNVVISNEEIFNTLKEGQIVALYAQCRGKEVIKGNTIYLNINGKIANVKQICTANDLS